MPVEITSFPPPQISDVVLPCHERLDSFQVRRGGEGGGRVNIKMMSLHAKSTEYVLEYVLRDAPSTTADLSDARKSNHPPTGGPPPPPQYLSYIGSV